jgi:hypothetical protein
MQLPLRIVALATVIAAPVAFAQPAQRVVTTEPGAPDASDPQRAPAPAPAAVPAEPAHEPCAADVAGAPVPGGESGRTDPVDTGDGTWRRIGRGALFVPKLAVDVALTPLRATVWAYDRFRLDDLYRRVFFNDALTIGLYPTVALESGFGITWVTGGARFVHRDLLGHREHLAIEGAMGAHYRAIVDGSFRSGHLLGDRLAFELFGGFERRPQDGFYGIGNANVAPPPAMPVDPTVDDTAVETRYRQQRFRAMVTGDVQVWNDLHLRPAGSLTDVTFGPGVSGTQIDTVYDPVMLVGFDGVRLAYGELEVRWDNRHPITAMEAQAVYSAGWLAAAFGGRVHRLDQGRDFFRYGVDVQQFLRLGEGPRVLATRLHGEAVSGSRDDVPFTELPKLGGTTYLRGYPLDRFRDRVAVFGSAEYEWDLSQLIGASVFVDAGRVMPSIGEASFDHLRVGYGIALEGRSPASFLVQGSLASSIDGGVFFSLSFNPVFALDERVRRNR